MDEVKNQLVKDVAALVNRVTELEQQVRELLTPPPTEPKRKLFQRRPKTEEAPEEEPTEAPAEATSEASPDEPAEEIAPSEQPPQQG
jgi:hypothetical protein